MSYSFATLPGSYVHGTSQAKMLNWTAISSSRGSSQPSDQTWVFCIGRRVLCRWATGKPFLCIRVSPQVGENGSYLLKVLKYLKIQVCKTQNLDFPGGSVTTEPGDMGSILGLGIFPLAAGHWSPCTKHLSRHALEPGVTAREATTPRSPHRTPGAWAAVKSQHSWK